MKMRITIKDYAKWAKTLGDIFSIQLTIFEYVFGFLIFFLLCQKALFEIL